MGMFGNLFDTSTNTSSSNGSSYSGLAPGAMGDWHRLFSGYMQGIAPWQTNAFNQAIQSSMSNFSGLNAAKGGLTPGMLPQIASNAAQYVAPQFALANSQSLDQLMGLRNISKNVFSSTGAGSGPGLGYSILNGFAGGAGQGMGQAGGAKMFA
jgi:hypothetical protein